MSIVIQAAEPAEEPARSVESEEALPHRTAWLRVPSYPRGLWLAFLKSRAAPWVGKLLTLTLFLLAALPDAGFKVDKYVFLAGLLVLFVVTEGFRQAVVKTGQNSYRQAAMAVGYIIGAFAGKLAGGTKASDRGFFRRPGDAVGIMLRRAKEYVAETLKVPEGEILTAALLVPERDASGAIVALEEAQHDDLRPGRHGIRLPLSLPGAAQAFRRAVPVALPDSRAEPKLRAVVLPYASAAYFPIYVGEPGVDALVVAVLSIDSTEPNRFGRREVEELDAFISPIAQLIGFARTMDRMAEGK